MAALIWINDDDPDRDRKGPVAPDIRVKSHGSIVLLQPLTPEAHTWFDTHLTDALWHGTAVACEPRYVKAILAGAAAEGLRIG